MKHLTLFFCFVICVTLSAQLAFAAGTGRGKGTPLKKPAKASVVKMETCFDGCHEAVEMLHNRGAHSKVNCGMCHEEVTAEHIESPSVENRPTVRTDHQACAKCHEQELKDMMNPKYHMAWAERQESATYSMIRNPATNVIQNVQYRIPRFHINILSDITVNRTGGRFKYINQDDVNKPLLSTWKNIVDTHPEWENDLNPTETTLAWRPHKNIGVASLATCLKCKTTDNILEFAWLGEPSKEAALQRDSHSMSTLTHVNSSYNCTFCHDPHSAEPRVVNDILIDGMISPEHKDNYYQRNVGKPGMTPVEVVEMGERGFTRKIAILEKYDSNFMCGQCHLASHESHSFKDRDTEELFPGHVFPNFYTTVFAEGPLEVYEHYKSKNWYNDVHPETGTRWARPPVHPHMEIVTQSAHGKAGVGCTDCHFAQVDGHMEHQPSLPKDKVAQTCMRSDCHGKSTDYNWTEKAQALYSIETIQQKTRVRTGHWNTAMSKVIEYLKNVRLGLIRIGEEEENALHEALAKSLTTEIYWSTDYSMGFHNPALYDSSITTVTKELNAALANAKKTEVIVNARK